MRVLCWWELFWKMGAGHLVPLTVTWWLIFLCRLLQTLNTLPVLGDTAKTAALRGKHIHGVTADGKLWILLLTEYANKLLSSEHVKAVKPFTKEQRDIWDR